MYLFLPFKNRIFEGTVKLNECNHHKVERRTRKWNKDEVKKKEKYSPKCFEACIAMNLWDENNEKMLKGIQSAGKKA